MFSLSHLLVECKGLRGPGGQSNEEWGVWVLGDCMKLRAWLPIWIVMRARSNIVLYQASEIWKFFK